MKAVILARVSTEEQKEAGNSLPAQQDRLISYIERNKDLELIKQFIFDESAYKEHRKEFEKIIKFIKEQKEIIAFCCDKVDRLSRDFLIGLPDLERLRRDGKIELHFPSDNLILTQNSPATDLFHFNIAVSLAQYYSNSISDNVLRTIEKKLKNGEVFYKAPLGYINVKDENDKSTIIKDDTRAHLITKIFELYASGNCSMKRTAEIIAEEGLRSRLGNELKTRQIEATLKNHFYYGYREYKGQLYPHNYEPLISYDLWKKCQDVRDGYKMKPSKYSKKPFIFRGLIKCANCGCMITPELKKKKYVYYHCTNYKGVCKKDYVKEEELLEPIRKDLDGIELPQKKIDELIVILKATEDGKNAFHNIQVAKLREEYDKIDARGHLMYDDKLDGRITTEYYDKKLKEYKEKQYHIELQLKKFANANKSYYIVANTILSLAKRAREIFESSEPEEKRQLLKFVFQNFELNAKTFVYKLKTPFDEVLLAKKLDNNVVWGAHWESNPD